MVRTIRKLAGWNAFVIVIFMSVVAANFLTLPAAAQGPVVDSSALHSAIEEQSANIDRLWVLLAAALVFLMQAGFLCFEVGCVRPKSTISVAMKNLVDWVMVSLVFTFIGFGIMFGHSWFGVTGTDLLFLSGLDAGGGNGMPYVFFIFQLAFAATAATIISGAMSERTGFVSYIVVSTFVGLLIYPVFGHWAWGNLFFSGNEPLLARIGFMDFAGSTVVHSVGGWIALVGILFIGPRLGRFSKTGEVRPIKSHSLSFSALGVFILWVGWWGFNGGSVLALNDEVGLIIANTNIAAVSAGFVAFIHCWFFQNKANIYEKFMGGILGGLVAITAGCNVVSPLGALAIGMLAGVIHNVGYDLIIKKFKLDDPVGAIPVHLLCGIFGTLAVGFFGKSELLVHSRLVQIGVQLVGVLACMFWTVGISLVMFKILKEKVGLRVSPQEERDGIQIDRREKEREEELIDEATIKELLEV